MSGMSIEDWQARGWRLYHFIGQIIPPSAFNVMIGVGNRRGRAKTELQVLIDQRYLTFTDWPTTFEGTTVMVRERQPSEVHPV